MKPGQSFPLLALMIVVIVGLVGLSVDVGNAYGQQRRVQNVANAGALAGLNAVIANNNNQGVWDNVKRTLAANRVDIESGEYTIKADYIVSNAQPQWLGFIDGASEQVNLPEQAPPRNIVRVQITVKERVGTYFARVVGRDTLEVNANGNACIGGFGLGVYPIGIPLKPTKNYHDIYNQSGAKLATNTTVWNEVSAGNWTNMTNMTLHLPIQNEGGGTPSGTHIAWLNWNTSSNANGNDALGESLTYPGDLQSGFTEGPNGDRALPTGAPNNRLDLTDWVDGSTGVKNGIKDELDQLVSKQRVLILPIYDVTAKTSGKSTFHIVKFGRFRLIENNDAGSPKYLRVKYLGDATNPVTKCSSEPDPDDTYITGKRFNIEGLAKVNRVWRENGQSTTTNDIVIVMDTSTSMSYDWNDRKPGTAGYQSSNARIKDAKAAVANFVRTYDLQADPDARISFITFGGTGSLNSTTTIQSGWTSSGCTTAQVTANTCTADMKWKTIQDKANGMSVNGYTPGPFAFERVQQLLQSAQTTRNGKQVRKVVLFATDGVFNVCGTYPGGGACPTGQVACPSPLTDDCLNSPEHHSVEPRPVWQGQQRSNEIKASGASIYVVALTPQCISSVTTCFNPKGLPEMSSGSGYYFRATDAAAMAAAYTQINSQIADATCVPHEQQELAPGATVRLSTPGNPTFAMSSPVDSEGRWEFNELEAGEYVVKADPYSKRSPEDGFSRVYSRVRNGLNLSEEGQVSVSINPQFPDGSTVPAEVLLSLPTNAQGVPQNGCTTPQ
jgi:hypothetical protein